MAEAIAANYPAGQGDSEQQFIQQRYSYQNQLTTPVGQQFYGGVGGGIDQQNIQESFEQQVSINQGGQDVNYAQFGQSGADLGAEQRLVGSGFNDQANAGLIQQYTGATGQVAQQQGQNGYKINFDPNPQIIRKHANDAVTYKQEVAVRYLRPPTPPPPGPLIIKEVRNPALPAAPPIVIRQRPPRPATPPPLIIRERPPQPPTQLAPKVVTKPVAPPPPPPRRVIIERMPPLPPKPQSIIVERWLPYKQQKRRVVYQKAPPVPAPAPQKNLIIQWEGTQARVVKEFRNLGIIKADPGTYVQQYGPQLRTTQGLPDFIRGLPTPHLGPEYLVNPDQIDPALLVGTSAAVPGFELAGNQGLLSSASVSQLVDVGAGGFIQEGAQYAAYGQEAAGLAGEQQSGYSYPQTTYSSTSAVEGQQYGAEQQQQQQGFEQDGSFAQNIQYQVGAQYGVRA